MPCDLSRESRLNWRKSSYSLVNGECVEVARQQAGEVAVRDSNDAGGAILLYAPTSWGHFIEVVKDAA